MERDFIFVSIKVTLIFAGAKKLGYDDEKIREMVQAIYANLI